MRCRIRVRIKLSDIHFRAGTAWDADPVLRDLARFIAAEIGRGADQDQVAKVLAAPAQRKVLLKRLAAYLKFYADWLGKPQKLPWWQRSIEIRGQRLHVAGLDSAWMACGDTDRGHLLLGRYQVNQTVLHPAQAQLGLEDLAGNCWEWCDDVHSEDQGAVGSPRFLRGGAFGGGAGFLRSSVRGGVGPGDRDPGVGFRCVLAASRQP
jgi:hypothetical protein